MNHWLAYLPAMVFITTPTNQIVALVIIPTKTTDLTSIGNSTNRDYEHEIVHRIPNLSARQSLPYTIYYILLGTKGTTFDPQCPSTSTTAHQSHISGHQGLEKHQRTPLFEVLISVTPDHMNYEIKRFW